MPVDEPATPALGRPPTAAGQATPASGQAEAVSVPAAARRLGRTPDAIRGDIRRGKLTARRGNDGNLMVLLPPIAPVAVDGPSPDLDRLRDECAQLADELATARRRADDGLATVAELRERLARLEGEAVAAGKIEAELREALAWQRQPFWRRWFG